ncbi:DUF2163 domain-containing protein [Pseudohoeflea suaedae]|uniref:DUF2163 domain-containing protein n=1 Tax=Pseudohoeflea suaedae TaxID=877384 RepID=A0A4R5PP52_9HYPH|nr:DUF2163 domain-containing protein [Pseudohoeflea suaedae]TDH38854.1 DUF2163 domain-containing protein [Pseudohoeflea suaedae]
MRQIPDMLAAHLEGDATTTCHAWRLTRPDGMVMGFTDHDRDLLFDGTIFAAMTGFADGSEVESGLGLGADAAEVIGAFCADVITRADLTAGRYDGALVETFLVNWQSPDEHVLRSTRELGEVRSGPDAFHAELRSLAARLDRPGGRVYSRSCDAELGDGRCRVDLDSLAYTASGAVSDVFADDVFGVSGLEGYEDGWFRQGKIRFSSGPLEGISFLVAEHDDVDGGARITLWSPPSARPEPGDGFTIVAGCDKRRETCRDRFANILNFQGFPFMPGSDFAYGYADGETEHDARPLIT